MPHLDLSSVISCFSLEVFSHLLASLILQFLNFHLIITLHLHLSHIQTSTVLHTCSSKLTPTILHWTHLTPDLILLF